MYDTVKGSDYLGDQDAIEFMCRKAPEVVIELEHYGMPFDRNENGTIYQRPFGGHSQNFGEQAGAAQLLRGRPHRPRDAAHALPAQRARAHAVLRRMDGARPDPRRRGRSVLGVTALEMETGEVVILHAKATLLRHRRRRPHLLARPPTPSSTPATASAWRRAPACRSRTWSSGSSIPTGVAGAGVLITEGVRGEGGYLLNKNGERFMERYAPTMKDLARRDVVSRAMATEIKEGRGAGRARRPRAAQARPPRARDDRQAPARHPRDRDEVRQRRSGEGPDPGGAHGALPDGRHPDQLSRRGGRAARRRPGSGRARASTPPASAPAPRSTAPTASAPTRSPTCWCSARPRAMR